MNKQNYEKLNNLAISFDYIMSMIELAEYMTGEFICGDVIDDQERAKEHIDRIWALLNGMVELSHLRHEEFEQILKSVPITEEPLE